MNRMQNMAFAYKYSTNFSQSLKKDYTCKKHRIIYKLSLLKRIAFFFSQLHEFVKTYLTQPVKQLSASSDDTKQLESRRRLLAR